jgi:hypothetical protein
VTCGARQRLRLSGASGKTRLSLVEFGGDLVVDVARAGAAPTLYSPPHASDSWLPRSTPLQIEAADCQTYANFCGTALPLRFTKYSLELPPGDSDLLITIYNAAIDYGSPPRPIWIDDLKLE